MRCGRTCRSSVSHSGGLALCGVQDCSPMYSSKSPRALLRSLSSLLPVSSWPSFPLGMRISVNGASGVRVRVWLRVILKYVVADALNYAKAPDPFGGRGRWPWRALRWCVPPWPGCTFAADVQNKGSRGRHHSSSSCIWVSFKPEWAFNVMAHVRDWEHAETVRRRCPSGQLEALHSEWRVTCG